jgi:hypothetical protein
MNHAVRLSRRGAVGRIACLAGTALVARIGQVRSQERLSKAEANYQDHPNGQQRCEICLQFRPPGTCQIVTGVISPTGWCQFFAARDNAR